MSDVTVTSTGSGYYEITHSSLATPERVRGKEAAEARAAEIAAAAAPAEGAIPAQIDIEAAAALAEANARIAELEAQIAAAPVVTVEVEPGTEGAMAVPTSIPRAYTGVMDKDTKKAFSGLNMAIARIVLEENESIPPTGLFLAHNGRPYMISPGVEVDVPEFLLSVLDDAVLATAQVDAKTKRVIGWRSRSRFPYRRIAIKN